MFGAAVGGVVGRELVVVVVVVGNAMPVVEVSPLLQAVTTKSRPINANRMRIATLLGPSLRRPHHRPKPPVGLEKLRLKRFHPSQVGRPQWRPGSRRDAKTGARERSQQPKGTGDH